MNRLVSVIIPIYNAEKNIKSCITSIQRQTYSNLEIICVNDGSKDGSLELLYQMEKNDYRIRIIDKSNEGVSSARNAGLDAANGYYIQFVDSDDAIECNMTEKMVSELENSKSDWVLCGYHSADEKISCSLPTAILSKEDFYIRVMNIYKSTYLNPPWNKLYIRSYIKTRFDETMSLGEDLVFNLSYLQQISNFILLEDKLYIYTTGNANSLTAKFHQNAFECAEKMIFSIIEFLPDNIYRSNCTELANCFGTDYMRCISGLINYSNMHQSAIETTIKTYNGMPFWRDYVIKPSSETNKYYYYLKHNNISHLINRVRWQNIKMLIKQKIKAFL